MTDLQSAMTDFSASAIMALFVESHTAWLDTPEGVTWTLTIEGTSPITLSTDNNVDDAMVAADAELLSLGYKRATVWKILGSSPYATSLVV